MKINFTCQCGARISMPETALYQTNSMICPACHEKISAKFIDQLRDFCVEKNSQYMDVSFLPSSDISMDNIVVRALSFCTSCINEERKKNKLPKLSIKSREDFFDHMKSEDPVKAMYYLLQGAIMGYHQELSESLERMGIDIGDIL